MARIQILELPEVFAGEASETPFVLVVDETAPQRIVLGVDTPWRDYWQDVADKIGARGVIVTPETIDIPANDLSGYNGIPGGDYTAFAATVGRALGIDTSSVAPDVAGWLLTACRELEKSEGAREQLRNERDAQAAAIERVRNEPSKPGIMNAQQEHPTVWMHGYHCGVLAARGALAPRDEPTVKPSDA